MNLKVYYKDPNAPPPTLPLTPGVCAVIQNDKNQILLHKRADNNMWTLPGGKMKTGESITECCKREIQEELNIVVDVIRLVGVYTSPDLVLDFGNNNIFQPFVIAFTCSSKDDRFKMNVESTKAKWFNKKEILRLDLIPYTEQIINHALNRKSPFFD